MEKFNVNHTFVTLPLDEHKYTAQEKDKALSNRSSTSRISEKTPSLKATEHRNEVHEAEDSIKCYSQSLGGNEVVSINIKTQAVPDLDDAT